MKKKILLVINTLGHAGAEVAMLELLKAFDQDEYEVSLYVLMGQGELIGRVPLYVKLLNKNYEASSVLSGKGKMHMIKTVAKAAVARGTIIRRLPYLISNLVQMMKKKKIFGEKLLWRILADGSARFDETYDLAIAYLEGGSTYYVADHVKAKAKAAFLHVDYERAGYTRSLDRDAYEKYDRVFTVSDEVKDSFVKAYPEYSEKTRIFHNILDVEGIREKSKEPGGFDDGYEGIRLLTVGRLTWQKAYDVAIDAMALLKKDYDNVRWYVLGEGPERAKLEKKLETLGLKKDFLLSGAKQNPYPYYAQTDIYVHATRFEGKSIAIQEAQALGCAIVASDCSGNREQIEDHKDGILCAFDAKAIRDSIAELLDNPEMRKTMGKAASERKLVYEEDLAMLYELMGRSETE